MIRLVFSVVVLAGMAVGAAALWRDPGLRDALVHKAAGAMDQALGVKREERPQPARPEPAVPARVAKPSRPAPAAQEPAPPAYVDRAPTPTTVERVSQKDRQLLTDILDRRLPDKPGRTVAKSNNLAPPKPAKAVPKGSG